MKQLLTVFTITVALFLAACNNAAEKSSTDTDTATTNSTADLPSISNDSATSHGRLVKTMDDMMGKMHGMKMTGDFDVDFANMMIEHHQGGVDMAQVEVSDGKDEKMKALAREIIRKQKQEQEELRDFVKNYKPSGMKHAEGELHKSMTGMESKMKAMQTHADIDKDFAMMMTVHHEEAVAMAKMQLKHGMSAELKKMAKKMIDDQQKEIKEFNAWMKANK